MYTNSIIGIYFITEMDDIRCLKSIIVRSLIFAKKIEKVEPKKKTKRKIC